MLFTTTPCTKMSVGPLPSSRYRIARGASWISFTSSLIPRSPQLELTLYVYTVSLLRVV